jgi:hypothetical protein
MVPFYLNFRPNESVFVTRSDLFLFLYNLCSAIQCYVGRETKRLPRMALAQGRSIWRESPDSAAQCFITHYDALRRRVFSDNYSNNYSKEPVKISYNEVPILKESWLRMVMRWLC